MPPPTRPVVFIGSSAEGLPIAQALQVNLDRTAEVILWSQGIFGLSQGSLENLVARVSDFDFAILVLTPDDLTFSRGTEESSPRDNVVFELGLFMGALGRTRTYIVYDRTADIKLPSDLAGVTPATYQPHATGSLQSALGACSTTISSAIQAQGKRNPAGTEPPIDPGVQFRVLAGLLEITARQFMILMHEAGVPLRQEGPYMLGIRYEYSVQPGPQYGEQGSGYFTVRQFCARLADADLLTIDLRENVGLSERGHAFADWLAASGFKADYFWSDIGNWGERPANLATNPPPSAGPRSIFDLHQAAAAQRQASPSESNQPQA